jgi:hypothetical protein
MILKHLPILTLHRVQNHHPIQLNLLRLGLPSNQIGLPQQNHGAHPHLGVP